MTSPFKAYLAGVGSVAVAIAIGFGGGLLIAERFSSTTAVPEQSKVAKQQDTKQSGKPAPTAKPAETETTGVAGNNHPQPSPQDFAPVVSSPAASAIRPAEHPAPAAANHQAGEPVTKRNEEPPVPAQADVRDPVPTEQPSATRRMVAPVAAEQRRPEPREPSATAQPERPSVAALSEPQGERTPVTAQPDPRVERPKARSERPRPERKQAVRQQEPKPEVRQQNQAVRGNEAESDEVAGRERDSTEARPSRTPSRQVRVEERRQVVEEDEQELSESVEVTTEHLRSPLSGVPFLGLFAR